MAQVTEAVVRDYIRAWSERDPAKRMALLEACFAVDGRVVTANREMRGRATLAEEIAKFHERSPNFSRIRLLSVIDARGTTFRMRGAVDFSDGTSPEAFDAGEVDTDGRIALVLTFAGPLAEANEAVG